MKSLSRKIEDRAIAALRGIINKHPTIEEYFNTRDTRECFDGFIRIYVNDSSSNDKANLDYDIPVQIKGHEDLSSEYMQSSRITWSVSIDDLKAYYRNNGCMYFVVMITKAGNSRVFYNSLYPSKIKGYIEEANNKGNKKTITIPFALFPEEANFLAIVMKQFAFEARKQGSGYGQIVPNAIHIKDLGQLSEISATTIGRDILTGIKTGDVVLYGRKGNDGIEYPIILNLDSASKEELINKSISIDGTMYYSSYLMKRTVYGIDSKNYQDDYFTLKLSENLLFVFKKTTTKYEISKKTSISEYAHDARFLIALAEKHALTVSDKTISGNLIIGSADRSNLLWYIDVSSALEKIKCRVDIPIDKLTDEQIQQLDFLRQLSLGRVKFKSEFSLNVYDWKFGDKYYPILVIKNDSSGLADIACLMFDTKHYCCLFENEDETHISSMGIIPNYYNIKPEVLANLLFYDFESMKQQIERSTISELTESKLNQCGLNLLLAYDICGNSEFISLALLLFSKMREYSGSIVYYINYLQSFTRLKGCLTDDQIAELQLITESNSDLSKADFIVFSFCRAVLLKDNPGAKYYYDLLSSERKAEIDVLPIATLFRHL